MHTTLNAAETDIIEEHRDGERYLIAKDIQIIQPKELTNGYVPERSIRQSTNQPNTHGGVGWEGVPATLRHPRNLSEHSWYDPSRPEREPVLSATANVTDELGMGELENQRFEDGGVFVDLAVNADRAAEIDDGAMAVVDALEDGDPLDVSTQYLGAELPPGEYDGRRYGEAESIVAPDSLALLPNTKGECSTVDGCGVNPVQSSMAVTANNADIRLSTGHSNPDEGDSQTPGTAQAIMEIATNAIDRLASAGSESPAVDDVDVDGVVGEFVGNGDDVDGEQNNTGDEPAESGADEQHESTMDREALMKAIMENSDIKETSLEGMGDSCLQTTHDSIVGADADDDGSDDGDDDDEAGAEAEEEVQTESEDSDDVDDETETVVMEKDELESFIDEQVDQRVTANEEKRKKERRVKRIVENSAEYDKHDQAELIATPNGILDRIEKGLGAGTELPPTGAPSINTGDSDDMDDIDVGTGMIDDIMAGGD